MSALFLEVRDVHKRFGSLEALAGVHFGVARGELFGLLGPNGAGKTTLLSIISGLTAPTSGAVFLNGQPFRGSDPASRQWIGIGTQDLAVYGELTARENLRFFGKLYGLYGASLNYRVDEVLELAALTERADDRVADFSGGMKRRLNLGVAVMHRPQLLLLDEPTTGVDPQSRNHIFERVRELNAGGMTIVYTSHYMEEVQTLCSRIAILDRGRIIACDTLAGLLQLLEGALRIEVGHASRELVQRISELNGIRVTGAEGRQISLAAADVSSALLQIVALLRTMDVELTGLQTQEPNLERVFLHLTDRTLRD